MKASEIKKALDPQVKKAAQNTVNKIKKDIKKQNQMKNNMPPKKETEVKYVKESPFGGLKEIVDMKKQKAISNEFDSLIFQQEVEKKKRTEGSSPEQQKQPRPPTPLEIFLAANPDKIKDMSIEEITKLSMLNSSGGSDPLAMILMSNLNNKNNEGGNDLTQKILGVVIEKMFSNNNNGNAKKDNGDMEIFKMMMAQNMQTQQMMMNMITKQNAPPQENQNNTFMKEIFGMVKGQSDMENTMLREKLKELEMRQNQNDPLGEAKRMLDYVKTFGGAFGGGAATPAGMNHELKMKELQFDQQKQNNEEVRRSASMDQIGGMINNTIETFGKILSKPIAAAAKSKLEQYTEQAKNPEKKPKTRISPEQLQQEIDLGDLENLEKIEEELAQYGKPEIQQKTSRFKVAESGK